MPRWNNKQDTNDEIFKIKRLAVFREAGRAFSQRGFHNTSLDDVAKALQVSKGTLYNYVVDKQEILSEFFKLAADIGERAIKQGVELGGSGAEMLRKTLSTYISLLTSEIGACGALLEIDALRPADRATAIEQRDAFERAFVSIVETGINDGSLRKVDPILAVYTFMGAINWMGRWYNPQGRLSGEDVATQMVDLLLAGLEKSGSEAAKLDPVNFLSKKPVRQKLS